MEQLQVIRKRIYGVRGQKVMLDRDLAEIYGVETRSLNHAVKRNADRFPEDFMFRLTNEETKNWKSQVVISNTIKIGCYVITICDDIACKKTEIHSSRLHSLHTVCFS